MAQKRYKFSVSTSSYCFLCFDNISMLNNNSTSLQNIFQYLKISLCKIKTLSTKPVKLLNKTDVRVSLCSECEKTLQEISKLYKIIELAQLKLDFSFEVVHEKLRSSQQRKRKEYQTKLEESSEELFTRHSNLVTELRQEILTKCDVKMPNYHPKVSLERIAMSVINELMKNHRQDNVLGPPCHENLSVILANNPEESHSKNEENGSVLIPEARFVKQEAEDFDIGHVDALDEPETDWNVDDLKEQELVPAGRCEEKSNANHKINYKQLIPKKRNLFAGQVPVEFRTCHVCKEIHSNRKSLLNHLRMHCQEKSLKFKSLFQRQQLSEKKWPCAVCKKSLSTKQKLADHLRIHFNEKPFQCSLCPKRYACKDALQKHLVVHANSMKVVPPSLLKYQCTICKKIFSSKSYLEQHKNKHTGIKPFECKLCGTAFWNKNYLQKHLKSHSKTVKNEIC